MSKAVLQAMVKTKFAVLGVYEEKRMRRSLHQLTRRLGRSEQVLEVGSYRVHIDTPHARTSYSTVCPPGSIHASADNCGQ